METKITQVLSSKLANPPWSCVRIINEKLYLTDGLNIVNRDKINVRKLKSIRNEVCFVSQVKCGFVGILHNGDVFIWTGKSNLVFVKGLSELTLKKGVNAQEEKLLRDFCPPKKYRIHHNYDSKLTNSIDIEVDFTYSLDGIFIRKEDKVYIWRRFQSTDGVKYLRGQWEIINLELRPLQVSAVWQKHESFPSWKIAALYRIHDRVLVNIDQLAFNVMTGINSGEAISGKISLSPTGIVCLTIVNGIFTIRETIKGKTLFNFPGEIAVKDSTFDDSGNFVAIFTNDEKLYVYTITGTALRFALEDPNSLPSPGIDLGKMYDFQEAEISAGKSFLKICEFECKRILVNNGYFAFEIKMEKMPQKPFEIAEKILNGKKSFIMTASRNPEGISPGKVSSSKSSKVNVLKKLKKMLTKKQKQGLKISGVFDLYRGNDDDDDLTTAKSLMEAIKFALLQRTTKGRKRNFRRIFKQIMKMLAKHKHAADHRLIFRILDLAYLDRDNLFLGTFANFVITVSLANMRGMSVKESFDFIRDCSLSLGKKYKVQQKMCAKMLSPALSAVLSNSLTSGEEQISAKIMRIFVDLQIPLEPSKPISAANMAYLSGRHEEAIYLWYKELYSDESKQPELLSSIFFCLLENYKIEEIYFLIDWAFQNTFEDAFKYLCKIFCQTFSLLLTSKSPHFQCRLKRIDVAKVRSILKNSSNLQPAFNLKNLIKIALLVLDDLDFAHEMLSIDGGAHNNWRNMTLLDVTTCDSRSDPEFLSRIDFARRTPNVNLKSSLIELIEIRPEFIPGFLSALRELLETAWKERKNAGKELKWIETLLGPLYDYKNGNKAISREVEKLVSLFSLVHLALKARGEFETAYLSSHLNELLKLGYLIKLLDVADRGDDEILSFALLDAEPETALKYLPKLFPDRKDNALSYRTKNNLKKLSGELNIVGRSEVKNTKVERKSEIMEEMLEIIAEDDEIASKMTEARKECAIKLSNFAEKRSQKRFFSPPALDSKGGQNLPKFWADLTSSSSRCKEGGGKIERNESEISLARLQRLVSWTRKEFCPLYDIDDQDHDDDDVENTNDNYFHLTLNDVLKVKAEKFIREESIRDSELEVQGNDLLSTIQEVTESEYSSFSTYNPIRTIISLKSDDTYTQQDQSQPKPLNGEEKVTAEKVNERVEKIEVEIQTDEVNIECKYHEREEEVPFEVERAEKAKKSSRVSSPLPDKVEATKAADRLPGLLRLKEMRISSQPPPSDDSESATTARLLSTREIETKYPLKTSSKREKMMKMKNEEKVSLPPLLKLTSNSFLKQKSGARQVVHPAAELIMPINDVKRDTVKYVEGKYDHLLIDDENLHSSDTFGSVHYNTIRRTIALGNEKEFRDVAIGMDLEEVAVNFNDVKRDTFQYVAGKYDHLLIDDENLHSSDTFGSIHYNVIRRTIAQENKKEFRDVAIGMDLEEAAPVVAATNFKESHEGESKISAFSQTDKQDEEQQENISEESTKQDKKVVSKDISTQTTAALTREENYVAVTFKEEEQRKSTTINGEEKVANGDDDQKIAQLLIRTICQDDDEDEEEEEEDSQDVDDSKDKSEICSEEEVDTSRDASTLQQEASVYVAPEKEAEIEQRELEAKIVVPAKLEEEEDEKTEETRDDMNGEAEEHSEVRPKHEEDINNDDDEEQNTFELALNVSNGVEDKLKTMEMLNEQMNRELEETNKTVVKILAMTKVEEIRERKRPEKRNKKRDFFESLEDSVRRDIYEAENSFWSLNLPFTRSLLRNKGRTRRKTLLGFEEEDYGADSRVEEIEKKSVKIASQCEEEQQQHLFDDVQRPVKTFQVSRVPLLEDIQEIISQENSSSCY